MVVRIWGGGGWQRRFHRKFQPQLVLTHSCGHRVWVRWFVYTLHVPLLDVGGRDLGRLRRVTRYPQSGSSNRINTHGVDSRSLVRGYDFQRKSLELCHFFNRFWSLKLKFSSEVRTCLKIMLFHRSHFCMYSAPLYLYDFRSRFHWPGRSIDSRRLLFHTKQECQHHLPRHHWLEYFNRKRTSRARQGRKQGGQSSPHAAWKQLPAHYRRTRCKP